MTKSMSAATKAKISATAKKRWRMKRRGMAAIAGVNKRTRTAAKRESGLDRAITKYERILSQLRQAKALLRRYS